MEEETARQDCIGHSEDFGFYFKFDGNRAHYLVYGLRGSYSEDIWKKRL